MAALPGTDFCDAPAALPTIATIRHIFTHFELELGIAEAPDPVGEGWWQPISTLADAGLPTLYRRAADAVLSQRAKLAA